MNVQLVIEKASLPVPLYIPPPFSPAVLLLKLLPERLWSAWSIYTAPPRYAELLLKVQLLNVVLVKAVRPFPSVCTAPPYPPVAVFPVKLQPVMEAITDSRIETAPPLPPVMSPAMLLLKLELDNVKFLKEEFPVKHAIAPPLLPLPASLLLNVQPETVRLLV